MKLNICTFALVGLMGAGSLGYAQTDQASEDPAAPASAPAPAKEGNHATTPADPTAVIPLIVMDEVPLTDAIRNLARQAGLNYMLDPKIGFGQPGADGRVAAQPMVSIRWENVTAQQALTALLGNHNLQIAEDPKTHIARISVKDPAAPDPLITKVIQLKYAAPTNVLASLQATFTEKGRSKALADIRTSQIIVLATEKEMAAVDELISRLDTPTKQVLIEARLVETSMTPSSTKGLDWQNTLSAQNITFGNNPGVGDLLTMSPSSGSFFNPATTFLNADGVKLVFSFLNQYAEVKVLSTPRTVTLDNEPAKIEVTRSTPIINVTAGTANTTGGSQTTYTNLGVILNVTPRISANNNVNLHVQPEVSRVFDTITREVGDATFEADIYDIRRMETHVVIPSGNTLVMGGMVQDDVRRSNSKVPFLGDIPGLGYAFRRDTKKRQQSNLLIFITPTIVQDEDFQPTPTSFLKSPVPKRDCVEPDWSSIDSGRPKDWNKKGQLPPGENAVTQPMAVDDVSR